RTHALQVLGQRDRPGGVELEHAVVGAEPTTSDAAAGGGQGALAHVAHPVVIGVGLIGVRNLRAVVVRVVHAIAVIVRDVAVVANAVLIAVGLIGIRDVGAIVVVVVLATAVAVAVPRVADAIVIEIGLIGVGDQRAVIVLVVHPVPVGVGAQAVRRRTGAHAQAHDARLGGRLEIDADLLAA